MDLVTAEERAQREFEEYRNNLLAETQEIKTETQNIQNLIDRYEKYKDITNLTSEQKKDLLEIQENLNKAFGEESDSLDLLNDKYDENIKKIQEGQRERAHNAESTFAELYKADYKNATDNESFDIGTLRVPKIESGNYTDIELDKIVQDYIQNDELTKTLAEIDGISFKRTAGEQFKIILDSYDSITAVDKYQEVYDALEKYERDNRELNDDEVSTVDRLMKDVQERQGHYIKEADDIKESAQLYAENILTWRSANVNGQELYINEVTQEQYRAWRDSFIEEFAKDDPILQEAINKALNKIHPGDDWKTALETGVPDSVWNYGKTINLEESIVTFNSQYDELINNLRDKHSEYVSALEKLRDDPDADLTEFYQKNVDLAQFDSDRPRLISEIIKANTQAIDELANKLKTYRDNLPNEEDKAKVDAFLDTIEKWKYVDNIDEEVKRVVDDFTTLKETAAKLSSGDYEASDLQSLFEKYPELKQYSGDVDTLAKKTEELAETQATDLLLFLNTLKKTATDPEVIAGLNSQIAILEHLNFTTNSWLEYETAKIDDIVDGLEAENKKLQEQLDIVEDTISAYETASDTVQNYISDQIKALEDQKQAVEDSYDAQIKEIQDKNKEREQEINLQEKLDALLNAKKKRVSVYSETNGWKEQRNSSAIAEAQREYDQALDDKAIADLEKKRDAETSVFDDHIKAWNDYADEWSDKMDKVKNISNEEKTAEVLGFDWRNRVNIQDKTLLDGLVNNYDIYLNKKKVQLDKEIADNSNRISLYQNLKDEMERSINGITTANNDYLNSLEKIAPAEIDSYEKRQAYLKSFLETQDKLLADSEYGSWLLGKKGATVDDSTIKGSQVIYDGANLLYQAITDKTLLRQKADERLKSATYGALADRNQLNRIKETYSSNNNYMFQFSGDIVTNDSEHFLAQIKQRLNLEKLQSKIGK